MARRSEWRGARPQFVVLDEAQPFEVPEPAEQQIRRQLGDDWDDTPAGVKLPPIPLGTLVETWHAAVDLMVVGTVEKRTTGRDPWSRRTLYTVATPYGTTTADRENITIFDRSPEGIERWLDDERPRTAEEVERFLGNA